MGELLGGHLHMVVMLHVQLTNQSLFDIWPKNLRRIQNRMGNILSVQASPFGFLFTMKSRMMEI